MTNPMYGNKSVKQPRGQKIIGRGHQSESRPMRHLNDGPHPPKDITWGQGVGFTKHSEQEKLNAKVPTKSEKRGAVFNRGHGEYSDD